jgi:ABC-type glutathione transport system ATPase component
VTVLTVRNLTKSFPAGRNSLGRVTSMHRAVDEVSFDIERGETLALVGESGAGKSTTGRMVLRLIEPDAGSVVFDGVDVLALKPAELRKLRRRMQIIQQDPFSALDPRVSIGESVAEPLRIQFGTGRRERLRRASELLERVSMSSRDLHRRPSELSGGQLQRVAIARALALEPHLVVCDEPVAALDVSIRAQVINLMKQLQDDLGLAYLFVSHDLALMEVIADRVAVMAAGRIVELGTIDDIYRRPQEEYTRRLLASMPIPIPREFRDRAAVPVSPSSNGRDPDPA